MASYTPSWTLSHGVGLIRPLTAFLSFSWFKFKNHLRTFVVLTYHYDWHTMKRFERKPGRWSHLWNKSVNPEGSLGQVGNQLQRRALFSGCVWSVSWFLDFQLKLYEQNWIQRFILIVRNWNSWAREAGVAEWLQRFFNKDSLWEVGREEKMCLEKTRRRAIPRAG